MSNKGKNIVEEKSFDFALAIIKEVKNIQNEEREYILTKQLIRSGTSIGAMVREAEHSESKKDFIHKMMIGLKEANETRYWLELLYKSDYLEEIIFNTLMDDCTQIIKLLVAIVKSSKASLN
ncbi:MAG: four helix bundle protein [Cellulophaga sp.]|nr:four helix bundle protein [Cellulophaga sp.]